MAITSGLFDQYLPVMKEPVAPIVKPTMTATTAPAKTAEVSPMTLTPRDLLDLAEEGQPATADPVDTVYEGDNRPTYIKERTNITAEQYNQFLSEFDDAVAQANLNYRQAILQQNIQQEATGTTYTDRTDAVLQNQALASELFQSAVSGIAEKYGVPLTYTTKGGERWELNNNGKYTRVTEVGGWDDYLKAAVKVGIMTAATAGLGSALAAGLSAAGVPTATANVIADVVVGVAQGGGDIKQGIINAFAPVPDELRQVTDYFPDGLDGLVDIARTVYDTANADTQPDVTTDFEVNIDPKQTDPITVDQDTGDVTVGLPEPTPETPTETTDGGGGGSTQTPSGAVTEPPTATPPTPTTPAETDTGIFNPELPWIYQGDGVFVNAETGETVVEDVTDYDPYVVGEGYGRGTDPTEAVVGSGVGDTTQETGTGDIFGDLGTIFSDTTTDVPVEPSTPVKTPTSGTIKPTTDATVVSDKVQPVEPPPTTVVPKVPTTSVEKPTTTTPTGTTTPTLPDETGGLGTGTDTTDTGGTGGGTGTGDGSGDGTGDGGGLGSGLLMGASRGGAFTPTPYMGSISFAPQLLTPIMPKQSRDYLAELIARLR